MKKTTMTSHLPLDPRAAEHDVVPEHDACLRHRPTGHDTWRQYRILVQERLDLTPYAVWQVAIREARADRKAKLAYRTANLESEAASAEDEATYRELMRQTTYGRQRLRLEDAQRQLAQRQQRNRARRRSWSIT